METLSFFLSSSLSFLPLSLHFSKSGRISSNIFQVFSLCMKDLENIFSLWFGVWVAVRTLSPDLRCLYLRYQRQQSHLVLLPFLSDIGVMQNDKASVTDEFILTLGKVKNLSKSYFFHLLEGYTAYLTDIIWEFNEIMNGPNSIVVVMVCIWIFP